MTFNPKLTQVGPYTINFVACPKSPLKVDLSAPRCGILHTTEGGFDPSLDGVFKRHFAPHFEVGMEHGVARIVQLVPVGYIGSACRKHNNQAIVQIEFVGFSQDHLWRPVGKAPNGYDYGTSADALAHLMVAIEAEYGIPLTHPWKDGDFGLAGSSARNTHRKSGKFGKIPGWYGHGDMPDPDCVDPEAPILCADLSWRAAGDLRVGDQLIAFDEFSSAFESEGARGETQYTRTYDRRRMCSSTVDQNFISKKECFLIHTDKGSLIASHDHPWLAMQKYICSGSSGCIREHWDWKVSSSLIIGDDVAFLFKPWVPNRSYDAGWLSGFFDGEGCLSYKANKTFALTASQRLSPTLNLLENLVRQAGFEFLRTDRDAVSERHNSTATIQIKGGRLEALRFLGEIRPPRLLENAYNLWDDALVERTVSRAKVLDIELLGDKDVASLSTSSRTYIANGFLVHNTHWDPGALEWSYVFGLANAIKAKK